MRVAVRILAGTLIVTAGCGGKLAGDESKAGDGSAATNAGGADTDGTPQGCSVDSALACPGSAQGYSCVSNPETYSSMLSCSRPTAASGYCCFRWSYAIEPCTPDNELSGVCPAQDDALTAFPYQCNNAADDPTSLNSALTCGRAVPDADGEHGVQVTLRCRFDEARRHR